MNMIAKIVNVSTPAVLKWIKSFGKKFKLPEGRGEVVEVELDEIWHFIKKTTKILDLESSLLQHWKVALRSLWRAYRRRSEKLT